MFRFSNSHFLDEDGPHDLSNTSRVAILRRRSTTSSMSAGTAQGGLISGLQYHHNSPLTYSSYGSPAVDSGMSASSSATVAKYNVVVSTAGGRVELVVNAGRRNLFEALIVFLLCSCLCDGEGMDGWPRGVGEALRDIVLHVFDARGPVELMAVLNRLVAE